MNELTPKCKDTETGERFIATPVKKSKKSSKGRIWYFPAKVRR